MTLESGRYLVMAEGTLRATRVPQTASPLRFDIELGEADVAVTAVGSRFASHPARVEMWPERLGRDVAARLGVLWRLVVNAPGVVRTGRVPIGQYLLAVDVPGFDRALSSVNVSRAPSRYEMELSPATVHSSLKE